MHKSGDNSIELSKNNLLDVFFEKNGCKCIVCGQKLTPSTAIVEHIYPKEMGGSDDISNLQFICIECNAKVGNKTFLGYQFEAYIRELLEAHPSYNVVKDYKSLGNWKSIPDIVCVHNNKGRKDTVIGEIKIATSFTENRIRNIIAQLKEHHEIKPDARLAFITPRDIPRRYQELFTENGIELWDRAYLRQEFASQIESAKSSQFAPLFLTDAPENEFDSLIRELRNCPFGTSSWSVYEKLVGKLLERLFCPPLNIPLSQQNDNAKKNRRDYILPNYSRNNDSWEYLRNRYSADYVVVDAKNSGKYVKKEDVLQIANYLKKGGTGLFGIIFSRKGTNSSSEYAAREMWLYEGKMIVILNDTDVEAMLLAKKSGTDPAELILKKIEDFRLTI